jgi:hypothetical protein
MLRPALLSLLVVVAACAQPARVVPGAAADLLRGSTTPQTHLVTHAVRLDQPTDAGRYEALAALLDERGLRYEVQEFTSARRSRDPRGRNLVVDIGTGSRDIIVGAHYDAIDLPDGQLSRGMVDNAASVAILVHAAEALQELELGHRVRIVFFDLEESGLVGSRHFVESIQPDRVAAMVNVDIAGYGNTLIFGPASAPGNEEVYQAMRRVCFEGRFTCTEFAQFPTSDDRSFQAAGIPNISLAVVSQIESHQIWLMLNAGRDSGLREDFAPPTLRTIHTAEDTPDKLDAAAMTLVYDAVMRLVLELDRELR